MLTKVKRLFIEYWMSSIKASILWLFIPIIILIVMIIGSFSYLLSFRQIEENTRTNISDVVSQTENYLNDRLGDVVEQFIYLENGLAEKEYFYEQNSGGSEILNEKDYEDISRSLGNIYSAYYPMIDTIYLKINNGRSFLVKKNYDAPKSNFQSNEWWNEFLTKPDFDASNYYWVNMHNSDGFSNSKKVVSLVKVIGGQNGSRPTNVLVLNLREEFFKDIFNNPKISEHGYLTILSPDGTTIFKNIEEKYMIDNKAFEKLRNEKTVSGIIKLQKPDGLSIMYVYNTLRINGWKIVAVVPEDEILSKANYIKYLTLAMVVFLTLVAIFLSNILAKVITKPITELTYKVKKIQEGDIDTPFDIKVSNEIGILNDGIGNLMTWIKNLLNQVRQEQEKKRQMELEVLQAQINPHFLYNTLYSIKHLCDSGQNKDASGMISSLSSFFRISISRGKEIISIEEELEHVKNYLHIQEMRYSKDFNYEIDVDPDVLNYQIVKLTLQPLVENAIYHGVKQKRGMCRINVTGHKSGDCIILCVIDNGIGMTEESMESIKIRLKGGKTGHEVKGYGIFNVNERIKIHFGSDYGIELESEYGKGATVKVRIPLRLEEE